MTVTEDPAQGENCHRRLPANDIYRVESCPACGAGIDGPKSAGGEE